MAKTTPTGPKMPLLDGFTLEKARLADEIKGWDKKCVMIQGHALSAQSEHRQTVAPIWRANPRRPAKSRRASLIGSHTDVPSCRRNDTVTAAPVRSTWAHSPICFHLHSVYRTSAEQNERKSTKPVALILLAP